MRDAELARDRALELGVGAPPAALRMDRVRVGPGPTPDSIVANASISITLAKSGLLSKEWLASYHGLDFWAELRACADGDQELH